MIAHDAEIGNAPSVSARADQLVAFARRGAEQGHSAHEVERGIWDRVLTLGREAFALFLKLNGTGDVGPQVALPDGSSARRLPTAHAREYRSVFGDFTRTRTCYGTRDGPAIARVPLDNRLQLPAGAYSYLLQQWNQTLGAESAFARVAETLGDILGVQQPVDSLEHNRRQMGAAVAAFRDTRPIPRPGGEGAVFVASADGKGIPMRRGPGDPEPEAHRGKGDKANKKRMAVVGAVYSVGRHVRTPEQVVAALFRDAPARRGEPDRPEPVGKHVWGRLGAAPDGSLGEPIGAVFGWLGAELERRNPGAARPVVCVMDGQECLWDGCRKHRPAGAVEVLDLLHVAPRLWQAAHLFHPEGTAAAADFVRDRLRRVLAGQSRGVAQGLRRTARMRGLCPAKTARLEVIGRYLSVNAPRMRYDEYLRNGYPIASGVIEGACRSYVKDRMGRSGMRWTREGAQAMLNVRSEYLNGQWGAFHEYRIRTETERLDPNRTVLIGIDWPLAV